MSETFSIRWDKYRKEEADKKAEGLRAPGTFESTCDEILDVLTTRRAYLERQGNQASDWSPEQSEVVSRLDELQVVRAIINKLKGEEGE